MRATIISVLGVAVCASAAPIVITSGQSAPALPADCGPHVVGFKRGVEDGSLSRRLVVPAGQGQPAPASSCGPHVVGFKRELEARAPDVGEDIKDGLEALGGFLFSGLDARDLGDDIEQGVGDVLNALPEIAGLASKFLRREPMTDEERLLVARGLGTTILNDAEKVLPEVIPLATALLRRSLPSVSTIIGAQPVEPLTIIPTAGPGGPVPAISSPIQGGIPHPHPVISNTLRRGIGTDILHGAEQLLPDVLPLAETLLKRGIGSEILHDAEQVLPDVIPLATALLRRGIGTTLLHDGEEVLSDVLPLASLLRRTAEDMPMVPDLTPLAGDFLRRSIDDLD